MQRRRCAGRVELREQPNSLARGDRVDLDAALPERLERSRIGLQAPVGACADHQSLGKLSEDVLEILEDEGVAVTTPPAANDPVGQDDQVSPMLLAVDEHPPELVSLDPRHNRSEPM